jgi:hypothetical protein
VCAYLMTLAMLHLAKAALELQTLHRVQQGVHSPLCVVPEGSVGTGRVRVETDQRTVFGPMAVERMKEGIELIVVVGAVEEVVALAELEEYGNLDSQ